MGCRDSGAATTFGGRNQPPQDLVQLPDYLRDGANRLAVVGSHGGAELHRPHHVPKLPVEASVRCLVEGKVQHLARAVDIEAGNDLRATHSRRDGIRRQRQILGVRCVNIAIAATGTGSGAAAPPRPDPAANTAAGTGAATGRAVAATAAARPRLECHVDRDVDLRFLELDLERLLLLLLDLLLLDRRQHAWRRN